MLPKLTLVLADGGAPLSATWVKQSGTLVRSACAITSIPVSNVSVVLVDEPTMRGLNRRYRTHDRITDVLSFTYQAVPLVGEIIICRAQAERQAKRKRHTLARELRVLFVHGCLHLMGHDHQRLAERRIMRGLERKLLAS